MEFRKEKYVMRIIQSGKKTNNGMNRTAKSRKDWNAWIKGKLKIGNIGIGHSQISGYERKNNQRLLQPILSCKIPETIPKMGRTQRKKPEKNEGIH